MSSNEPPNRRSLESRLTRLLLLGCGALLLLTGWIVDRAVEHWMRADFDRSLGAQARALISLTEQEDGVVEFDFVADLMPEFGEPEAEDDEEGESEESDAEDDELDPDEEPRIERAFFQLWLDGDRRLARSPSLGTADLSRSSGLARTMRFSDVVLPNGRPARQVQADFVPQVETESDPELGEAEDGIDPPGLTGLDPTVRDAGYRVATLVVARPTSALIERILFIRWALVGSGVLLLALLALLVRLAVRTGLRPLRAVTRQVDALDTSRLGQRIDAEPPAELGPLVVKLNDMLARLEAAFERERRFSSDVAHELRTPIAELRSLAEVGGRWPDDRIAVQQFFGDTRAIAEQMERVVSQLLMVARTEAGIETVDTERIGLAERLEGMLRGHRTDAERRGLTLRTEVPRGLWCETDAAKLELIVHNLLRNAVAYAPRDGAVDLRAELRDGVLVIAVWNLADNLDEADLPHLFDRFWRRETARATPGSSGLGLSLVKSLCDLMGITIETSLDGGVFRLELRFPADAAGFVRQRAAS